jgi:hypothetical protein
VISSTRLPVVAATGGRFLSDTRDWRPRLSAIVAPQLVDRGRGATAAASLERLLIESKLDASARNEPSPIASNRFLTDASGYDWYEINRPLSVSTHTIGFNS